MTGNRIRITGIVQGVGFRPFVYSLAIKWNINGFVRNDVQGVEIQASGTHLESFLQELRLNPPPLAKINTMEITNVEVNESGFAIIGSLGQGIKMADIGIDSAVCADCLREMFDKTNRRYLYPFINCTNCGPRYTIITELPYDRDKTTLQPFPLCDACKQEFTNPLDRRFHAQGNCCPVCGPQYNDIPKAVRLLSEGGIVAIKGIGGYHLACDTDNPEAIMRLRALKNRDEKPFAIMVNENEIAHLEEEEKRLLLNIERPIVLTPHSTATPLAPGLNTLGIMLPYAPIHHLLFHLGGFRRLVMTSGNRKNEPMATGNGEIRFKGIADFVLEHNREIAVRNDDSVARRVAGAPVLLRRSRGFAPTGISVGFDATGFVGCGAMLKNSIALGRDHSVYLSQYIGDLQNEEAYESLVFTYRHLSHLYGIKPKAAVCDLHPNYFSSRFAESLGLPVIRIQHHVAHAYACMAEHQLTDAIAVVYDGAGLGDDGHIWGGEIFSITQNSLTREQHLTYMPMPGGDVCVDHPLRLAAAVLAQQNVFLPNMEEVIELVNKRINLFHTSGMGRLFDAASALLGACTHQTYEGQAPMMLEAMSAPIQETDSYNAPPFNAGSLLLSLYRDEAPLSIRAGRFHNTLIQWTASEVLRISREKHISSVVLSGGCFQNKILVEGLLTALKDRILVYTHRLVPPNDGGIALGQITAAAKEFK